MKNEEELTNIREMFKSFMADACSNPVAVKGIGIYEHCSNHESFKTDYGTTVNVCMRCYVDKQL